MTESVHSSRSFDPIRMWESAWAQAIRAAEGDSNGGTAGEEPDAAGQTPPHTAFDLWNHVFAAFEMFQNMTPSGSPVNKLLSLGLKSGRVMVDESMKRFSDLFSDINRSFGESMCHPALQNLAAVYESRVCRILNIPQLGLTREYQQRLTQAADEFNHFSVSMIEFANVLALPMRQAIHDVWKSFSEASEDADLKKDPQAFYKMWLQFLEKHYLSLLSSRQFMDVLHRLLNRYADYWNIQQSVIKDFLKVLPVCTTDDFDELARDNYALKKELKALKKNVRSLEAQIRQTAAETQATN